MIARAFCHPSMIVGALLAIVIAWSFALRPMPAEAQEATCVDTALVLVMDVSSSMKNNEIQLSRQAHARAIVSDDVVTAITDGSCQAIALTYIEYAMQTRVAIDWTIVRSAADAYEFAIKISALDRISGSGGTYISEGLAAALRQIDTLSIQADRIVVDVIGDGVEYSKPNTGIGDLLAIREAIVARYAIINAMPLMLEPDNSVGSNMYKRPDYTIDVEAFFCNQVAAGRGSFCIPTKTLDDLDLNLRTKIIREAF